MVPMATEKLALIDCEVAPASTDDITSQQVHGYRTRRTEVLGTVSRFGWMG